MEDSVLLEKVIKAIETIADDISDDDGWSPLSEWQYTVKMFPDFDVRNYGFNKLAVCVVAEKLT